MEAINASQLDTSRLEDKILKLVNKKEASVSPSDLAELLTLVEELDKREEYSGIAKWFRPDSPYSINNLPKHAAFIAATRDYREILLLGGNRSGKTSIGAYICTVLATGLYPSWWTGVRYDGPVEIWACGKTGQSTRDTVQEALMGRVGAWGTGMIPAHLIGRTTKAKGTSDLLDTVEVIHTSGKVSIIGFKTYKQDAPSFYGSKKHLVWLDEPCPEDIYNECLIRTSVLPGGYEGRLIHTITPKEGMTRLLADFLANCDLLEGTSQIKGLEQARALMKMEDGANIGDAIKISYGDQTKGAPIKRHRAAIAIGWDDVPWMSDAAKREILESTPPHLRETVSQGIPSVGDGNVYQIPLHNILMRPEDVFQIPAHYKKVYGLDVGWQTTAAIFGAQDPDTGILYIYGEHYLKMQPAEVHAARIRALAGDWQIGLIDPASNQKKPDGKSTMQLYRTLGLRLREADNTVETGIMKVSSMLSQGKIKFFPYNTPNLQNEYLIYRRDQGKVVKEDDHAMDALRYLVMGLQFAKPTPTAQALGVPGVKGPLIQNTRRYNV